MYEYKYMHTIVNSVLIRTIVVSPKRLWSFEVQRVISTTFQERSVYPSIWYYWKKNMTSNT